MRKYETDPAGIGEDTEWTRFCPRTDGRTSWKQYTPHNSISLKRDYNERWQYKPLALYGHCVLQWVRKLFITFIFGRCCHNYAAVKNCQILTLFIRCNRNFCKNIDIPNRDINECFNIICSLTYRNSNYKYNIDHLIFTVRTPILGNRSFYRSGALVIDTYNLHVNFGICFRGLWPDVSEPVRDMIHWYHISLERLINSRNRGRFKNTYELLNQRALKFSYVNKIHIFQCMGKIFCVEFQRYPLKFHTKYLTHTLKDMILRALRFKSS